jgi:hypothetical protein
VQICGQKEGIINAHFRDRKRFAFGSREKGKLDRRGEEGELRDKKAAASRFKLFLSLVRQGMDSALEDGSMASKGWLLRITVRSTAAFWPWRSQANPVGRALPRRVSARRRQAWNVMPVLEKVLWRSLDRVWLRLTPDYTRAKGKKNSRIRIGVRIHGLGLGEPYTPNRSVTALVATRSSFFGVYFGV